MEQPLGSANAIGGPAEEVSDVPVSPTQSSGGLVGPAGADAGYKKGGKVSLKDCKVTTHQKSKSSPNW
jgi:hypothetical protein